MDPIDRLEKKIDKLTEDLGGTRAHMNEVKVDLREHMRRTSAVEDDLALLRQDFAPVKTHVAVVGALVKGLGLVGTVVGILVGLMKLLGK